MGGYKTGVESGETRTGEPRRLNEQGAPPNGEESTQRRPLWAGLKGQGPPRMGEERQMGLNYSHVVEADGHYGLREGRR
jgi:hypothetical protein